jgi:hypothetical protein
MGLHARRDEHWVSNESEGAVDEHHPFCLVAKGTFSGCRLTGSMERGAFSPGSCYAMFGFRIA